MKTRMFSRSNWIRFALTVAVVGMAVFVSRTQAGEKKVDHTEHHTVLQECAKACSDCQRACDLCTTHCAHQLADNKKDHLACLMECQDCATCCAACAQVCARGGPQSAVMADCCAKCCDQCAKACEAFPNDAHMKVCGEECRKSEKACRAIVRHMSSK